VAARRGDAGAALPGAVAVAAGQAVRGLVLRLGAPAAIEGQVVTRAGAPVAGASLGLSPAEHGGEFGRVLSDAAGRFAFRGLAPGEYDLDAGADGLGTALRRGLTVAAGDRFELTLTLSGTGAVEGTVTDGAGGPVAGARLRGGTLWGTLGEVDAEAISGDDGRYRLAGLAPGRVRVEGRRPGAASSSSALVLVEEGRTARADLTLAATGALEGTVRRRSGAPAADGVRVAVAGGPGASMARGGGALEVEAGGRFAASLGEGSWRLYATAGSGHAASRPVEQAVEVRAGRTARVELVLDDPPPEQDRLTVEVREPGGAPAPGALVFVARAGGGRGAAVVLADEAGRLEISGRDGQPASQGLSLGARSGGRTAPLAPVAAGATAVVQLRPAAEVRGRVVEGGRPVSGFHLALELPDEEALGLDLGLGRELPGSTFDLADVPAGALRLTATTPDGRTGAVEASVAPGAAAQVVIELRREGTVTGRVVDAAGAPVAGAFVMLGGRDPSADGGTGADGRFRLQAVPPGRQEVQAFVPRTGSAARSFEISAGQELDLGDLVLSPSGGGHP
jgi:protocatechuate 3,4-dioxygenase beta subunit